MSAGKSFWEMDEMRIITGAMVILGGATALLVVMPYMLLRDVPPPVALKPHSDIQLLGRQTYIANGCVYCHSQLPRDIAQAPDFKRGWGRASIACDYAHDTPHLLGTMRNGWPQALPKFSRSRDDPNETTSNVHRIVFRSDYVHFQSYLG